MTKLIFVTLFASSGVSLLLATRAATPNAHFEAENATLSGVTTGSDANASGGQFIQFGSASSGGGLNLQRIPWEGGSNYWKRFSKADAAGMDDPTFFPLSVFLGAMQKASYYKSIGLNTYQAIEHNIGTFSLASVTNTGMLVMAQQGEWTQSEVGNNGGVVSWFISDECEMGYSNCTPDWNNDNGEYGRLAVQQSYVNKVNAYNDGRFKHANFGNGVTRTWWAPNTMDDHIALLDSSSADKYAYTSPDVQDLLTRSPTWPSSANPATAAAYGWQIDQMLSFQSPVGSKPVWGFIETARPFLNESGARTITPNQLEGGVWSMIIHGARGMSYFMHNNDYNCNQGSACWAANEAKLTAINAKIKSLAPVLNTQSYYNRTFTVDGATLYEYTFNNGTDAMLKTYNGAAYIFAGIGLNESPGNKTFTLPTGVNGTSVEVVSENRALPVNANRQFTDNFAAEYSHHVYKINL